MIGLEARREREGKENACIRSKSSKYHVEFPTHVVTGQEHLWMVEA